jgi:uncharacterized protein with von Willebrand factor type A (vWA) domain
MARQYQGIEKVGRGPIVVVVDESSSMRDGTTLEDAKALALTMAWVAKHQKRWCCLVGFSGPSNPGNLLILKPGKWNEAELLNWLTHFYNGGTSPAVLCRRIPEWWDTTIQAPKGKTDVIFITDGEIRISPEMAKTYTEWKAKEKVKLISLVLGGADGSSLQEISDETHAIRSLRLEEEAVQKTLAI